MYRNKNIIASGVYRFCTAVLVLCCVLCVRATALPVPDDTLATLNVTRLLQPQPNTLEFDLRLSRDSDLWEKWANGTFQLTLPGVDLDECTLEVIPNTSDLDPANYIIADSTLKKRMSITILGPDEFWQCAAIDRDTGIRLGRFRITAPVGIVLPTSLAWAQPYNRYQANGFKISADSLPWNAEQDNIEMLGRLRFLADSLRVPEFFLKYFTAKYIGDRRVLLCWETRSEAYNKGFVLRRGIRPFGDAADDYSQVYFEEVARYTEHPDLQGLGMSYDGKSYCYVDTVPFRDEEYVYQLLYENYVGADIALDTASVIVPSSVIAFAQANPNPFRDQTVVDYILDDRVTLSCKVYDPNGKEVAVLLDNVILPIGKYNVRFEAPAVASQGLYDVVFIAYPVDDPSVELSTAVVKLQLIR